MDTTVHYNRDFVTHVLVTTDLDCTLRGAGWGWRASVVPPEYTTAKGLRIILKAK